MDDIDDQAARQENANPAAKIIAMQEIEAVSQELGEQNRDRHQPTPPGAAQPADGSDREAGSEQQKGDTDGGREGRHLSVGLRVQGPSAIQGCAGVDQGYSCDAGHGGGENQQHPDGSDSAMRGIKYRYATSSSQLSVLSF